MSENLTIREILYGRNPISQRAKDTTVLPEYPHLMFRNIEHYHKAVASAKGNKKALESLQNCLAYLERVSVRWEETVELAPDVAVPNSFYFVVYDENSRPKSNGGVIQHGNGVNANVELDPKDGLYWSIHT